MMNQTGDALIESIPKSVAWLGYGGLLPFVALTTCALLSAEYRPVCQIALILYGAVILSFVGALHWAFAMTLPGLSASKRSESFVWSVVPALLAWPAALLMVAAVRDSFVSATLGATIAAGLLLAGFISNFVQDARLASVARIPAWYLPLRLRLTVVACVCIAAAGYTDFVR